MDLSVLVAVGDAVGQESQEQDYEALELGQGELVLQDLLHLLVGYGVQLDEYFVYLPVFREDCLTAGQVAQCQTGQFLDVLVFMVEHDVNQEVEKFFPRELNVEDHGVFGQRGQVDTDVLSEVDAFGLEKRDDSDHDILEDVQFVLLLLCRKTLVLLINDELDGRLE